MGIVTTHYKALVSFWICLLQSPMLTDDQFPVDVRWHERAIALGEESIGRIGVSLVEGLADGSIIFESPIDDTRLLAKRCAAAIGNAALGVEFCEIPVRCPGQNRQAGQVRCQEIAIWCRRIAEIDNYCPGIVENSQLGIVTKDVASQKWSEGSDTDAPRTMPHNGNLLGTGEHVTGNIHAGALVAQPAVEARRRSGARRQAEVTFDIGLPGWVHHIVVTAEGGAVTIGHVYDGVVSERCNLSHRDYYTNS